MLLNSKYKSLNLEQLQFEVVHIEDISPSEVHETLALYLEEYGNKNKINRLIEINISTLAGVPSIVYGYFLFYESLAI